MTAHLYDTDREADAAFFEDWSWGRDDRGLWLWPVLTWRVIAVRPKAYGPLTDLVTALGGKPMMHNRYDTNYEDRDYHIPAARWREVMAAKPRLIAHRAGCIKRRYGA